MAEHTVTLEPSDRHVVVRLGDRVLAATDRPLVVHETGLPDQYYVPEQDLQVELEPSDTHTTCPYKGVASYGSVPDGPADVAWTYPSPKAGVEGLAGHWCFWGDAVTSIT